MKQRYLIFVGRHHYGLGPVVGFSAPLGYKGLVCETNANLREYLTEAVSSIIVFDCEVASRVDLAEETFAEHQVMFVSQNVIEERTYPEWANTVVQVAPGLLDSPAFQFAAAALVHQRPSAVHMLNWGHYAQVWQKGTVSINEAFGAAMMNWRVCRREKFKWAQFLQSMAELGFKPEKATFAADGILTGVVMVGQQGPTPENLSRCMKQHAVAFGTVLFKEDGTMELGCFRHQRSAGNACELVLLGLQNRKTK